MVADSGVNEKNILCYINHKIQYNDTAYLRALREDACDRKLAKLEGRGLGRFNDET